MRIGVFVGLSEHVCDDIRRMKDFGFESGQLNSLVPGLGYDPSHMTQENAEKIRKTCEETGFEFTAVFAGWSGYHSFKYPEMYRTLGLVPAYLRERRMRDILTGADFAYRLGVTNVFTHIGYVRDDPHDPDREEIKLILRHIATELGKRGQSLQIETGEMIPLSLVQLIHDIGCENVGVNFDPANFLTNARANPSDALDLLVPYVRGVHAKDAVYPTGTNPKGHETPIGQGRVDFPYIIRVLRENGYDGDLTIEREISGEEQLRDIVKAAEYLRALI